ncbi:hypothetical protein ES703_18519 [subsurface metagenome]
MVTPKNVEQVFVYKDPKVAHGANQMRISTLQNVYKDPKLAHAVNQTSIVTLQNGEILMGFNEERYPIHADSGQSCLIKSKDGGKTWDPATKKVIWPYTDFGGNWDCSFAQISDGTILMHTRVCSFIAPWGIKSSGEQTLGPPPGMPERLKRQTGYALLKSKDNGNTWTDPIPVNTSPVADSSMGGYFGMGAYAVGGSGAGHIVELPDGGLIFALEEELSKRRSFLLRSDDGGDNWEYWATMAYDPAGIISWGEPGMTRLKDGKLICLYRTAHRPSRQDNMWFNYSDNDGITWSPPERTSLWGFPADVLQLQDGRVLAVYGYRKAPWGVRGCVSQDGMTWDIKNEFVIREGGAAPSGFKIAQEPISQYWHIGYPTVTQLKDGTIIAAFHEYSDDKPPIQYLRCTRFEL